MKQVLYLRHPNGTSELSIAMPAIDCPVTAIRLYVRELQVLCTLFTRQDIASRVMGMRFVIGSDIVGVDDLYRYYYLLYPNTDVMDRLATHSIVWDDILLHARFTTMLAASVALIDVLGCDFMSEDDVILGLDLVDGHVWAQHRTLVRSFGSVYTTGHRSPLDVFRVPYGALGDLHRIRTTYAESDSEGGFLPLEEDETCSTSTSVSLLTSSAPTQ